MGVEETCWSSSRASTASDCPLLFTCGYRSCQGTGKVLELAVGDEPALDGATAAVPL